MRCLRARDEGADVMRLKRANVCWPMVFAGGFRLREADAETDGKCHRGQVHMARQEPDGQRLEREIRAFPALAQTYTKKDKGYGLMRALASLCDLWRGAIAERKKSHSLAFDRPRKIWKTWSVSGKAFKSGEEKAVNH